jgi:Flp pilus assembly protein TadB
VVQQAGSRYRDKGLVYCELKLEELYERLGVVVKQVNLENLYGARVKDEVDKLVRQYLLLFLGSLFVLLFVFGLQLDILLTYVFIFVIPLTYFYGVRYRTYKEIKNRLR